MFKPSPWPLHPRRPFAPVAVIVLAASLIPLCPAAVLSGPQPAPPALEGSTKTSCTPSFPQKPLKQGTRVVFFTSASVASEGAEAYLDGKCQGLIRREAPNRNTYSLMTIKVPPGKYVAMVRKQGYKDFSASADVVTSNEPPEKTPKVIVKFQLEPK